MTIPLWQYRALGGLLLKKCNYIGGSYKEKEKNWLEDIIERSEK